MLFPKIFNSFVYLNYGKKEKIKTLKDISTDIDELVLSKLESVIKSNTKKNIMKFLKKPKREMEILPIG